MGSDDEFGPDTASIRAWLDKRATYAADRDVPLPPVGARTAAAAVPTPAPSPAPRLPNTHDAGRSILEQLAPVEPPTEPVEAPTEPVEPAPVQEVPEPEPVPTYVSEDAGEQDLPPAVIEFRPRQQVRRTLTVVLLLSLAATVAVGAWAATQPTPGTLGVAACLIVLVLVVWAVRASSTPTRLTVRRGHLEVVRNGQRSRIELASPFTPVAVLGEPGRRGWQVLIERLDGPVLTLTAADVEPEPFMRVLLRLRPDLRG